MIYNIHNYKPLSVPRSIEFNEIEGSPLFELVINGVPVSMSSRSGSSIKIRLTKDECLVVKEEFNAMDDPYPFIIRNFRYGGFSGKLLNGFARYKASFINWTGDPGIARMLCSDGVIRLIPTFALKGKGYSLPYDATKKVMFGESSRS